MVAYEFNIPFVKYYREHLDEYSVTLPFRIANLGDTDIYAVASIVDKGKLGWTFKSGATSKNYTVNASSDLKISEVLTPATKPTETMRDDIVIKIDYYKDKTHTQKFGEDTLNVAIHMFIQNENGSWTSTKYPDESKIVFDYWDFTTFDPTTLKDGFQITGVNKKALLHFAEYTHNASIYATKDVGLVSNLALELVSSGENSTLRIIPLDAVNQKLITNKFFTVVSDILDVHKWLEFAYIYVGSVNDSDASRRFYTARSPSTKKALFIPLPPLAPCVYINMAGQPWDHYHHRIKLDGFYLFNLLEKTT